jgi:hypothetical protein
MRPKAMRAVDSARALAVHATPEVHNREQHHGKDKRAGMLTDDVV